MVSEACAAKIIPRTFCSSGATPSQDIVYVVKMFELLRCYFETEIPIVSLRKGELGVVAHGAGIVGGQWVVDTPLRAPSDIPRVSPHVEEPPTRYLNYTPSLFQRSLSTSSHLVSHLLFHYFCFLRCISLKGLVLLRRRRELSAMLPARFILLCLSSVGFPVFA